MLDEISSRERNCFSITEIIIGRCWMWNQQKKQNHYNKEKREQKGKRKTGKKKNNKDEKRIKTRRTKKAITFGRSTPLSFPSLFGITSFPSSISISLTAAVVGLLVDELSNSRPRCQYISPKGMRDMVSTIFSLQPQDPPPGKENSLPIRGMTIACRKTRRSPGSLSSLASRFQVRIKSLIALFPSSRR